MDLLVRTYEAWAADRTIRVGAGLAYYGLIALAPILIVAIGIAGLVFGSDAAQGLLVERMEDTIGTEAAGILESIIAYAEAPAGTTTTVVGAVALLFSASVLFVALQDAFNVIWNVPWHRGWRETLRKRLLAFAVVISCGLLLVVALVVNVLVTILPDLPANLDAVRVLTQFLGALVPVVVLAGVLTLLFKYLPEAHVHWRDALVGAALTSLVLSIATWLTGLYLGRRNPVTVAGAAGSLLVALLWIYVIAQVVLAGAQFIKVESEWRQESE